MYIFNNKCGQHMYSLFYKHILMSLLLVEIKNINDIIYLFSAYTVRSHKHHVVLWCQTNLDLITFSRRQRSEQDIQHIPPRSL